MPDSGIDPVGNNRPAVVPGDAGGYCSSSVSDLRAGNGQKKMMQSCDLGGLALHRRKIQYSLIIERKRRKCNGYRKKYGYSAAGTV